MDKFKEGQKIKVTYPDCKNEKVLTIEQLHERFREETPEWLSWFISKIIRDGYAYTNFGGKYELI